MGGTEGGDTSGSNAQTEQLGDTRPYAPPHRHDGNVFFFKNENV